MDIATELMFKKSSEISHYKWYFLRPFSFAQEQKKLSSKIVFRGTSRPFRRRRSSFQMGKRRYYNSYVTKACKEAYIITLMSLKPVYRRFMQLSPREQTKGNALESGRSYVIRDHDCSTPRLANDSARIESDLALSMVLRISWDLWGLSMRSR